MLFRKITHGYVVQVFNDAGEFVAQQFVAGDQCDYETAEGDPINSEQMPKGGGEYHPYTMENAPFYDASLETYPEIEAALDP